VALHARTAKRQRISELGAKRQLPLRVVLLILAFVPSAAIVTLLAVNSGQLYNEWHTETSRENSVVSRNDEIPSLGIFYGLQAERSLTAATLADPSAYKAKLAQVRKITDASTTALESLSGAASPSVTASLQQFITQLRQLPDYRASVDDGSATQQQAFDDYTGLITSDTALVTALTQTGIAGLDIITAHAMAQVWGEEMISREDAIITAGAVSGRLTASQRSQIDQAVGAEQYIYQEEVVPLYPAPVSGLFREMLASGVWQQKTQVEQSLVNAPASAATGDSTVPPALGQQWQQVMNTLTPELQHLTLVETGSILASGNSLIDSLKTRLIVQTILGVVGVVLVLGLTWWLISMLRRRIFALRAAAGNLETRLPVVVERLRRGEPVDTDAELPELHYGRDELGMLGRALNAARASALETSVRQVEQYRAFERLLQRIARRTQLLIGLQMRRLSEMERRYEDSELLEGLFDLDHLTARLRRYEENLVILGGGQPQRRWRKPVPLLNVLRSAQGEVQDYRRIRVETDSRVWISERAVGPLVHVLAELMENAVAFSKPPTPVEVTASPVARGLAIEIEDRGMGMDAEQYAEANALMVDLPRMDVLSRADDARLGLYVVARLAANLDLRVELRPSSYGGTRVVVLIPTELVLTADQVPSPAEIEDDIELVPRLAAVAAVASATPADSAGSVSPLTAGMPVRNGALRGSAENADRQYQPVRLLADVSDRSLDPDSHPDSHSGPDSDSSDKPPLAPLPRRIRQANLVTELREASEAGGDAPPEPDPDAERSLRVRGPGRFGATVGAFQRQSRLARLSEDGEPPPDRPAPGSEQTREEDGR
jgi:signal transduction histidine kinase